MPSDCERKDHVTKLSYLAVWTPPPPFITSCVHSFLFLFFLPDRPTHLLQREGDGKRNILLGWHNKTIITFGFCDVHNNQSLDKGYQPQPLASADNPYLDLDYSGYHRHLIQQLFITDLFWGQMRCPQFCNSKSP